MQQPTQHLPCRNWRLPRVIGRGLLKLLGWKIEKPLPDVAKAVLVVAPHTSNWDFIIGMAAALAIDLDACWLGKHTLFNGPWARVLQKLGGIPVDRGHPKGLIAQVVRAGREREHFIIGMAPEGTRSPATPWKSGCYRLAHDLQIPLVPIAFDYSRRLIRVFPHWVPDADQEKNMLRLSHCYSAEMAKNPRKFLPHSPPQH